MGIWTTVGADEPQIVGIPDETEAAHYRGEGEATATVDVAVTSFHDKVRLGIEFDGSTKDVLLSPDAVQLLVRRLNQASTRRTR